MAFVFAGIVFMFTLLFALGSSMANTTPGRADHSCTGCILLTGAVISVLISATHYINWSW